MGSVTVDDSAGPLVLVRFVGAVDDAAFGEYLAQYRRILSRGERYGVLFDALRAASPSPAQRRAQAEFIRDHEADLRRMCVGGAFAIDSPIIRGAMTAILWLSPMPFPYQITPDVPSARNWLQARLGEAGLL